MNGKSKCRILKEIRRQIAEQNDIEWVVSECSHKGNCKGTCPKCESEVRRLEQELAFRRKIGKTVAIAGISAACVTGLTACSFEDVIDYGQELIEGITDRICNSRAPLVGGLEEETETYITDDLSGYIDYPEERYELDGDVDFDPRYLP